MSAVIIGSGSPVDRDVFEFENINAEYIICADGGLEKAEMLNITPSIIIGDLDSVSKLVLEKYRNEGIETVRYPREKNYTDMELAIEHAVEKGYTDIVLIGAAGSRLDHTLANILLIEKYFKKGINIRLIDNNNRVQIVKNNMEIKNKRGFYVSIVPLTETIEGLTLRGFKYPLHHVKVERGSTLCVSNEISEDIGIIEMKKGSALVFISRD